jgi:polysaccharide biosynthesis/export protein
VKNTHTRRLKAIAAIALLAVVAACSMLPAVGPSKRQIYEGSVQRNGNAFVVDVNDHVTRAAGSHQSLRFDPAFQNAGVLGSDTISAGDTLGLTIYENVDDGLLAASGSNVATLEEVQVDGAGFIFVPYAGRVRAAGNTPEAIRRIITNKLEEQTPDPQVQVRRLAGDGSTVTLLGKVGAQGVYPIERPTRKLTAMLASAGGGFD